MVADGISPDNSHTRLPLIFCPESVGSIQQGEYGRSMAALLLLRRVHQQKQIKGKIRVVNRTVPTVKPTMLPVLKVVLRLRSTEAPVDTLAIPDRVSSMVNFKLLEIRLSITFRGSIQDDKAERHTDLGLHRTPPANGNCRSLQPSRTPLDFLPGTLKHEC